MFIHNILLFPALLAGAVRAADYKTYQNEYQPGPGQGELGHCGVFVETLSHGEGTGTMFHVVGSVGPGPGMTYHADVKTRDVKGSPEFKSSTPIGFVASTALGHVDQIGRSIPPPKSIFQAGGFKRITPAPPHYTCREWARDFIEQLKHEGVLTSSARSPSPAAGGQHGGQASSRSSSPSRAGKPRSIEEHPIFVTRSELYALLNRGAFDDLSDGLLARDPSYAFNGFAKSLSARDFDEDELFARTAEPYEDDYLLGEW